MFGRKSRGDADAMLAAIGRSQAMIEFAIDGTILTANQNFLNALDGQRELLQGARLFAGGDRGQASQPVRG